MLHNPPTKLRPKQIFWFVEPDKDQNLVLISLNLFFCTVKFWFFKLQTQKQTDWYVWFGMIHCDQSSIRLNEIRGTPLSLTAAASALLGQVWFAIYVNRRLHSMSVRSLNLSLADSLDLYSPLLRGSFLAVHGPTSWPTSSMEETSSCYVHH